MRHFRRILTVSFLAVIGASPVSAQTSGIETASFGFRRSSLGVPCPPGILPSSPGTLGTPSTPDTPGTPNALDPANPPMGVDPGAQASLAGTGGGDATALPQSIGDQGATYRVLRVVSVPVFTRVTTSVQNLSEGFPFGAPVVTQQIITSSTLATLYETAVSRAGAGFKIGDNESPRPVDRVFFTYNGYFNVPISPGLSGTFAASGPNSVFGDDDIITTSATASSPAIAARSIDIHRWMLGFEKTLLDGNASVGIRLPVFGRTGQGDDNDVFNGDGFGDMTLIGKYALINNPQNNNILTAGLALTVPTGPAINSLAGNINSVLWQPYVGYIVNFGDAYFQGFSSVVVPTNSNDVVVMFNDVGVGFVAYRSFNRTGLTAIVPTIECHITTPLNTSDVVEVLDTVSLTGGVHLGLGQRSWLTLGVNTPVTGPRPYSVEAICQFNYRF